MANASIAIPAANASRFADLSPGESLMALAMFGFIFLASYLGAKLLAWLLD